MPNHRINTLLAKKLAGEASSAELTELAELLRSHPEEQYFYEILTNWWESGSGVDRKTEETGDEHFDRIIHQLPPRKVETEEPLFPVPHLPRRRIQPWKIWLAAASVTGLLFLAGRYLLFPSATTAQSENVIVAQRGTKSKLLLPDGTQVWLNSDSRIIYANSFNDTIREVRLEGEAYFDVVKDVKRPFIVHTSGINIRVLGTAFNVKSYPQEPTIEATLVRGLIEVEKNNQPQSSRILLKPNEKLVYNKQMDQLQSASNPAAVHSGTEQTAASVAKPETILISTLPRNLSDSVRAETSWVYGKLIFEAERFSELAPRMERWFNIRIRFRDEKVANYRFTGVFQDENIGDALHALQLTASFTYTETGNEIWIDKK
jgi:ferric-dicitrate binding protein FerR (iron transport regulator)